MQSFFIHSFRSLVLFIVDSFLVGEVGCFLDWELGDWLCGRISAFYGSSLYRESSSFLSMRSEGEFRRFELNLESCGELSLHLHMQFFIQYVI
jgi:hypothetical protein